IWRTASIHLLYSYSPQSNYAQPLPFSTQAGRRSANTPPSQTKQGKVQHDNIKGHVHRTEDYRNPHEGATTMTRLRCAPGYTKKKNSPPQMHTSRESYVPQQFTSGSNAQ
ncbi:unnamed protein product, partial [Ectocarpus sp. 12 AP-2014]